MRVGTTARLGSGGVREEPGEQREVCRMRKKVRSVYVEMFSMIMSNGSDDRVNERVSERDGERASTCVNKRRREWT